MSRIPFPLCVRPAALLLAAGLAAALALPAAARDQIRVVGSSTVFPFATAVAEDFGRRSGRPTPVVESTGSGGGLALFCAGVGLAHPDVANASRRIKASEVALCERNGVAEIVEVKIGYDGIVLATSRRGPELALSKEQIFRALAREVPADGALVPNPHRTWRDVDPALPDVPIEVLGPPPTSGTRDAFVELAMEGGAAEIPVLEDLKARDEERWKQVVHAIREDGAFVEAGENDNLIVQKLEANPQAVGIFGFSFLDQNADRLRGAPVDGVAPSFEHIASGEYGISRSLYVYLKKAHVGRVPGLQEYVGAFLAGDAAGPEGYLADRGLIPLSEDELARARARVEALEPLALAESARRP